MNAIDIFPWNDNFNTGLPQIDEHHRKLVQLINALACHIAFRSDIPALQVILDELFGMLIFQAIPWSPGTKPSMKVSCKPS